MVTPILELTPIGFGAWAIGGSDWQFAWGWQDDNDSIAAIHKALDLGVNWIDTAAVYGLRALGRGRTYDFARAKETAPNPRRPVPSRTIVLGSGITVTPCSPSASAVPLYGVPAKPVPVSKSNGVVLKDIPGNAGVVPFTIAKESPRLKLGIELR